MGKTVKKLLLIALTPFILYYGAITIFVIQWGMADSRIEQICVETQIQNGVPSDIAQKEC